MNDSAHFRAVMSRFTTGVTVVTTVVDGIDHAMTASSFVSLSLDPQLVLVCVEKESRFHEAILGATHWGVSLLAEDQRDCAAWFATRGRPLEGQLDRVAHHRAASGVALIEGALGWIECRTHARYDGGDHDIVIGEVISMEADEGLPLVYFRGHYRALSKSEDQ